MTLGSPWSPHSRPSCRQSAKLSDAALFGTVAPMEDFEFRSTVSEDVTADQHWEDPENPTPLKRRAQPSLAAQIAGRISGILPWPVGGKPGAQNSMVAIANETYDLLSSCDSDMAMSLLASRPLSFRGPGGPRPYAARDMLGGGAVAKSLLNTLPTHQEGWSSLDQALAGMPSPSIVTPVQTTADRPCPASPTVVNKSRSTKLSMSTRGGSIGSAFEGSGSDSEAELPFELPCRDVGNDVDSGDTGVYPPTQLSAKSSANSLGGGLSPLKKLTLPANSLGGADLLVGPSTPGGGPSIGGGNSLGGAWSLRGAKSLVTQISLGSQNSQTLPLFQVMEERRSNESGTWEAPLGVSQPGGRTPAGSPRGSPTLFRTPARGGHVRGGNAEQVDHSGLTRVNGPGSPVRGAGAREQEQGSPTHLRVASPLARQGGQEGRQGWQAGVDMDEDRSTAMHSNPFAPPRDVAQPTLRLTPPEKLRLRLSSILNIRGIKRAPDGKQPEIVPPPAAKTKKVPESDLLAESLLGSVLQKSAIISRGSPSLRQALDASSKTNTLNNRSAWSKKGPAMTGASKGGESASVASGWSKRGLPASGASGIATKKKSEFRQLKLEEEVARWKFPGFTIQLLVILKRSAVKYMRSFWPLRVVDILLLIFASFIIGFIHGTDWKLKDVPGNTCMAMTALGVLSTVTHLRTFTTNQLMVTRETNSGVLIGSYFLSQNIMDLVWIFLAPALFLAPYYFLTSMRISFSSYYVAAFERISFSSYYVAAFEVCWWCSGMSYLVSTALPAQVTLMSGVFCALILGAFFQGLSPSVAEEAVHYSDNMQNVIIMMFKGIGLCGMDELLYADDDEALTPREAISYLNVSKTFTFGYCDAFKRTAHIAMFSLGFGFRILAFVFLFFWRKTGY
eukprot:gene18037-24452_t